MKIEHSLAPVAIACGSAYSCTVYYFQKAAPGIISALTITALVLTILNKIIDLRHKYLERRRKKESQKPPPEV